MRLSHHIVKLVRALPFFSGCSNAFAYLPTFINLFFSMNLPVHCVFLYAPSALCANVGLVCPLSHAALGCTNSEISLLKLTCGRCASTAMSGCQRSWNGAWPGVSATAKSARKNPPSLCRSACFFRSRRRRPPPPSAYQSVLCAVVFADGVSHVEATDSFWPPFIPLNATNRMPISYGTYRVN